MMFKITFTYTQTMEVEWKRFDNFEGAEYYAAAEAIKRNAKEYYIN